MLPKSLNNIYLWGRRQARHWVTRSPAFDRWVGGALRGIDRRMALGDSITKQQTSQPGSLNFDGFDLHHRPEDMGIISSLIRNNEYEPETCDVVQQILKPGMRFVDLGANIGFFTLIGARAVGPAGAVYAFEPIESTAEVLARNMAANHLDRMTTVECKAISDTPRELTFALHPKSASSHKMAQAADRGFKTVTITATSLDAYFEALNWPEIHLIKMDVEGAEFDAMRGMHQLSEKNPQLKLIFEMHFENLRRCSITGEEMFNELTALGFKRFSSLHHRPERLNIPADITAAVELARRVNYNILCEKE